MEKTISEEEPFSIIVVGAGTASLFLVHSLHSMLRGRQKPVRLLLLERGDLLTDSLPEVRAPHRWGEAALSSQKAARVFRTEPQPDLLGRCIACPVGNGVGGSSNVNAMIWTAGHRSVFDQHWPKSWNSDCMDSLFRQVAATIQPRLSCTNEKRMCNMSALVNDACKYTRITASTPEAEVTPWAGSTCSHWTTTKEPNLRLSLKEMLLDPLLANDEASGGLKVSVSENCEVLRVIFSDGKYPLCAEGVEVLNTRTEKKCIFGIDSDKGEIILSAGTFETPKILHRSFCAYEDTESEDPRGARLKSLTRNIGRNLLDHSVLPFIAIEYPDNCVHGWVYFDSNGDVFTDDTLSTVPSYQLVFVDGRALPGMFPEQVLPHFDSNIFYKALLRPVLLSIMKWVVRFAVVKWVLSCCFGVLLCRVQPHEEEKRGRVCFDGRSIEMGQEGNASSLWTHRVGPVKHLLAKTRQLLKRHRGLWFYEILPGPLFAYASTPALLKLYYQLFVGTYYHHCGTCQMGTEDRGGVVDEELLVMGAKNIRVADASVLPWIPSGPIAATVMAVGLKAGRLVSRGLREA